MLVIAIGVMGSVHADDRTKTLGALNTEPGIGNASISLVDEALPSIARVLNEVSLYYTDGALHFTRGVGGAGNALRLLRLLNHGMRAQMGKVPVASSKEDYPLEL